MSQGPEYIHSELPAIELFKKKLDATVVNGEASSTSAP